MCESEKQIAAECVRDGQRLGELVCLAGATIQIIYGLAATRFHFWENDNEGMEALWAVVGDGFPWARAHG